jgi:predicted DNA-binding transcriptional regulator AlpA
MATPKTTRTARPHERSNGAPSWKRLLASELVAMQELQEVLGVSRKRVAELVNLDGDFPEPAAKLGVGRIWLRREVVAWNRQRLAKLKKRQPASRLF